MEEIFYDIYKSSFCDIILVGNENGLKYLNLNTNEGKRGDFKIDKNWIKNSKIFISVKKQLDEYFCGKRNKFDVKINLSATEFQKKVYDELQKIPYGKLYTYKDIAIKIGNDKASRAVGMANSKNPIPLIIPCHRVVGTSGNLIGFAHGLNIKEKLIEFEKNNK